MESLPEETTTRAGKDWVERQPWVPFVLPFAVYLVVQYFEPAPRAVQLGASWWSVVGYPLMYSLKIACTLGTMWLAWPVYRSTFRRIHPAAWGVGVLGVLVWVGVCSLKIEQQWLAPWGLKWFVGSGERPAFNPWQHFSSTGWAIAFLGVRFLGLACVVPVVEEFFLRGFLLRYYDDDDWTNIPLGHFSLWPFLFTLLTAVVMHPAECVAEIAWFSLVSLLFFRTRNLWDCVAAHTVTNFLLGVYILSTGEYQYW